MKHAIKTGSIAWAATIGLMGPLHAADIDLFLQTEGNTSPPNIYMMLDASANWNQTLVPKNDSDTNEKVTKKEAIRSALHGIFIDENDGDNDDFDGTEDLVGADPGEVNDPAADPVRLRIGFGLYTNEGAEVGGKNNIGGFVYQAVEDFTNPYQKELADRSLFDLSDTSTDFSPNKAPYALSYNESFAYFAGEAPVTGTTLKPDDDYEEPFVPDPDAFTDDDTLSEYKTPAAGNCGKNYQIYIGTGNPDSGEDGPAETALDARGGSTEVAQIEPDNYQSNWSDEYARFMSQTDVVPFDTPGVNGEQRGDYEQQVRTYVLHVFNKNDTGNPTFEAEEAFMKSQARQGDGRYFAATNEQQIKDALNSIINEVTAVNSVFAASTLPVSVNVRGTNLNQVYMGVFRPSAVGHTRWQGNLKLYQLALDEQTSSLFLADQNGDEAQSEATGFIRNEAVSFWTHDSTYWDYDKRGIPRSGSDKPDGPVVEKGGAHQQIRDLYGDAVDSVPEDRPLHTVIGAGFVCLGGCLMDDFDTSTDGVDESTLNTSDSAEAQALVDWVHGRNNVAESSDDPDTDARYPETDEPKEPRPSVHGDVLHSKPAVINYGDGDIFAFYGANDGIFHALRAGKDGAFGDGEELWGFVPREFFDKLKELRNYDPNPGDDDKEYFADGGVGVLRIDANNDDKIDHNTKGDKVHLFIAMRRGGPYLYALDVTDPNNPEFLWKATPERDGYAALGQTWSAPKVTRLEYDGTVKDVLVFGGGYDPTEEDPDASGSSDPRGAALFVVDAKDGSVIWQATNDPDTTVLDNSVDHASMTYPIPSDVTVINDRIYVGDTGGQVWSADISGPPDDDTPWDVHRLASVGEAEGRDERKFLFAPDVVFDEEPDGTDYYAVLLGSGDREAPFKESVTNRFYMFKDKELDSNDSRDLPLLEDDPATETALDGDLYDATDNLIQDGTSDQQTTAENELNDAEGWFITLENAGEKVVSSAVTLNGTTFFNTNEPPDDMAVCGQSLGTARFYEVAFDDGTATAENDGTEGLSRSDRTTEATAGGFPPSPVPVIVEIDGKKYQAVISGTETKTPPGASLGRRYPGYRNADVD